jgi:circadian clock protein KaiC
MPKQPSGIPQLDRVLGGGVPGGDLVLVMGAAGTGKTTLALQMAFHTAARGEAACFVSTTSESPKRLLQHARTYRFYDEAQIGRRLFLLNVFPLIQEGLQPVREALEREVRERGASLLVLDGLMTVYDLHSEPREVRRFLFELSALLSTLGCTLLVTSSRMDLDASIQAAELTMADVLIHLSQSVEHTGARRLLQPVKVRGQTPLLGLHTVSVDERGMQVFPRFESLAGAADAAVPAGRRASGLPELDGMLFGGLPAGSVTALAGAAGTGKTLLSLQFLLEGASRGEPGLLLSLRETRAELIAKAHAFNLDLETPLRSGTVRFVRRSPVDLAVDQAMHELAGELDGGGVQRFVLDGILELLEPIGEEPRRGALMHVLADRLRSRAITAMIPVPVGPGVGPELDLERTPLAALAHNLLLMRYVEFQGELHRILSILKARDSDFDASIRRYMITSEGLRILTPAHTTEGLLSGIARLASEARVKRRAEPGGEG